MGDPSAEAPPPETLGPFAIDRELGRGGMGVVYAARHEGRKVALKVSVDDLPTRDRKHFLEEAELLSKISHPGVIEILDSGELEDGRPYLVMPLLQGETLAERLRKGRLDADLALRLFAQLAAAVAALHDAGIVHRDIKPENVMYIEDEERLVLLDFGIAREIDRPASTTTRLHLVRGTPGCMAPERFFGMRASASSDVYELAVVLYAMVCGQLPWDEPTDPEARLRPRHPSEIGVDLPVGLGHVLLEALSARPDRRPSARELAVRVRAVEGAPLSPAVGRRERTTVAQPVLPSPNRWTTPTPRPIEVMRSGSLVPSDAKPSRRVPAPVWVVGAVVLTSLAVGGSFSVRSRRAAAATLVHANAGLGKQALSITLHLDGTADPAAAGAAPPSTTVAAPETAPNTEPGPRASSSPAAPAATATATTAASPGLPWCTKMVDLYCSPTARKRPGGDALCAEKRASLAKMKDLPDTTRARGEAQCRDAIPTVEQSIRAPQSSEAPEDMPWCKRVAAVYCSPEVKNTAGGEGICAQGRANFYERYLSFPPDARIAQNEKCAQVHPGVVQGMRMQVRDMGPGTAGSARYAAAMQGVPPVAVLPRGPAAGGPVTMPPAGTAASSPAAPRSPASPTGP